MSHFIFSFLDIFVLFTQKMPLMKNSCTNVRVDMFLIPLSIHQEMKLLVIEYSPIFKHK